MQSPRARLVALALVLVSACSSDSESTTPSSAVTITSSDGAATLVIPEGALPAGVSASDISITRVDDPATSGVRSYADAASPEDIIAGKAGSGQAPVLAYQLLPDGLVFSSPATLTVRVAESDLAKGSRFLLVSAQGIETLAIDEVKSAPDAAVDLRFSVNHFSWFVNEAKVIDDHGTYSVSQLAPALDAFFNQGEPFELVIRATADLSIRRAISYKTSDNQQVVYYDQPLTDQGWRIRGEVKVDDDRLDPTANENAPASTAVTENSFTVRQRFACKRPGNGKMVWNGELWVPHRQLRVTYENGKEISREEDRVFVGSRVIWGTAVVVAYVGCMSCGNGNVDYPEGCDDGNRKDGDGCSSFCKKESWACCAQSGCKETTDTQCTYEGGNFLASRRCTDKPDPCTMGACCQSNGTCVDGLFAESCTGTFHRAAACSADLCLPDAGVPDGGNHDAGVDTSTWENPHVTGFTPQAAAAGEQLTINGTRLGETFAVHFQGTSAAAVGRIISKSATQVIVEVPVDAKAGTIAVFGGGDTQYTSESFIPLHRLKLSIAPSGSGRIVVTEGSSSPETCTADCTVTLSAGLSATISAIPAPGFSFVQWTSFDAKTCPLSPATAASTTITSPTATALARACKASFKSSYNYTTHHVDTQNSEGFEFIGLPQLITAAGPEPAGNVLVIGKAFFGSKYMWLLEQSKDGTRVKDQVIPISGLSPSSMALSAAGPIIAGSTSGGDPFILRWGAGAPHTGLDGMVIRKLLVDAGNVVLVGMLPWSAEQRDLVLARMDSSLGTVSETWSWARAGWDAEPVSALLLSDGSVVVVGAMMALGQPDEVVVLKISRATGYSLAWAKRYGVATGNCKATWVAPTADGGFLIGGNRNAATSGTDDDAFIMKLDASGNVVWAVSFASAAAGQEVMGSVAELSDTKILFSLFSRATDYTPTNYLGALNTNGTQAWLRSFGLGYAKNAWETAEGIQFGSTSWDGPTVGLLASDGSAPGCSPSVAWPLGEPSTGLTLSTPSILATVLSGTASTPTVTIDAATLPSSMDPTDRTTTTSEDLCSTTP